MMASEQNIHSTEINRLQEIADEYPYYAIAQLDLLKSFETNRSPAFHQQAAKTALFFSNTYWLSWQLEQIDVDDDDAGDGSFPGVQETRIEKDEEPAENFGLNAGANVEPSAPSDMEKNFRIEKAEKQVPNTKTDQQTSIQQNAFGNVEQIAAAQPEESKVQLVQETSETDEPLAFEPLHTVDYFASQGIKITEEPMSNDKLGKQMKSFTEWLKSMKKIHAQKLPTVDENTDRRIQHIADESNFDAEVFTESMAEVYEKQGKTAKAIEVYDKLSLINPAKSAYFAAKIDRLNTN